MELFVYKIFLQQNVANLFEFAERFIYMRIYVWVYVSVLDLVLNIFSIWKSANNIMDGMVFVAKSDIDLHLLLMIVVVLDDTHHIFFASMLLLSFQFTSLSISRYFFHSMDLYFVWFWTMALFVDIYLYKSSVICMHCIFSIYIVWVYGSEAIVACLICEWRVC